MQFYSSMAQTLSKGRQHISHQTAPDIWVEGIQTDLYSALSNLVFNAVRYTPEGGNIDLTLARGEDAQQQPVAVFSVRDSGSGIAAEHIPRLTERFYRVDSDRSRQTGGTGLGLAIVKHVLMQHQAHLEIESKENRGSIFKVVFPKERLYHVS